MEVTTPSVQQSRWGSTIDALVLLSIRIVVGGVFIVFGVAKALESQAEFMTAIAQYEMVPSQLLPAFALLLTIAEIAFGICFLLGLWTKQSIIGLGILLVMFMVAVVQAMARGLTLDGCGCSGSVISLGDTLQDVLIRDGVLLALLAWAWIRRSGHRWTLDQWFARTA